MKPAKKLLAMTLAVCMLIGVPLCIDVAATGDPQATDFRLIQAMMIPEHWENTELDRDTQVALYFTGHLRNVNTTHIKAYIGIVGASDWNYDGSIRHYSASWLGGQDTYDRLSFSGTLTESSDPALAGENNAYNMANTNNWVFTMDPNSLNNVSKEANIAPQYQHLVEGDKVDTIPELFALAKAAGKRLAVVLVDSGSTGETLNNMLGRTVQGGSLIPLVGDTTKANPNHGNNNGSNTGAHAIVYDETTAARMTGVSLNTVNKTLTVSFSEPVTVRRGLMSGLMVLNRNHQLMAQADGKFAVQPTTGYGVMFNSSAYPLSVTDGNAYGTAVLDDAAYNRILSWQKLIDAHNAAHPDDPLRMVFFVGEESSGTETTYPWRGEAKSNYYMDSIYTADLRPLMANYKKNATAGLNDFMAAEITVTTDLQGALNGAAAGTTVTLNENITVEGALSVPVGVTLDLNGKTLTAERVYAVAETAQIIDRTEGGGLLALEKNSEENQSLKLAQANAMMPLYDGSAQGYRLFTATLTHLSRDGATSDSVKFGLRVELAASGYALLTDAANADVELVTALTVTADGEELLTKEYAFTAQILSTYAQKKALADGQNWTIALTVSGLDGVDGEVSVTSSPRFTSSTNAAIAAAAIVK